MKLSICGMRSRTFLRALPFANIQPVGLISLGGAFKGSKARQASSYLFCPKVPWNT